MFEKMSNFQLSFYYIFRFIIHNDHNNPLVSSLEKFQHALKTFSTDLLVVSGLQMMDNYPFKRGELSSPKKMGNNK